MNAIAPNAPRQTAQALFVRLESEREIYRSLLYLAAGYYAIDMRPIVLADGHVERIGPDPVPTPLRDELTTQAQRVAEAEALFVAARKAEVRPRKMTDKFYLIDPDGAKCICPECGWNGLGVELKAQKCPVCDSSVREIALSSIDTDDQELADRP